MKTINISFILFAAITFIFVPKSLSNIIDETHGVGAGSFELGAYSQNSGNEFSYMRLFSGSTTVTGWTVGGADGIDWLTEPSHIAHDGLYAIDLAGVGYIGEPSSGSIATVIPTLDGEEYTISFYAYILGTDPVTGTISAGSLNQSFSPAGILDPKAPTWTFFEFSFFAAGSSTAIQFSTNNSAGFGPVIDNVTVLAVPEPSSALLVLMAGSAWLFKKRKKAAQ